MTRTYLGSVIAARRRTALEKVERPVAVVGGEAKLLRGHCDERIPHLQRRAIHARTRE